MDLVRDVLDNQIIDRRQQKMGKVDGIVIELRAQGPPRLVAIEQGSATLARRIHPRLGGWAERLGAWLGVRGGQPFRIPWSLVQNVGIDVEVDLEAEKTPALAWEHWMREHLVRHIPGGG